MLLRGFVVSDTYRVFEPGYPDDPDHDAPEDGPQAQQHELGGGVALVHRAVGAGALGSHTGTLGSYPVVANLSENIDKGHLCRWFGISLQLTPEARSFLSEVHR